jgi:hypothetical protein
MEQHASGVRLNAKLFRYLPVAHIIQVSHTKDLCLGRRQFGERLPQLFNQLLLLRNLNRARIRTRHSNSYVGRCDVMSCSPESPSQLIYRARRRQTCQQSGNISNTPAPRKFQGTNESFLKTISSVASVAEQSVRNPPDRRAVFFDNSLPVNHL